MSNGFKKTFIQWVKDASRPQFFRCLRIEREQGRTWDEAAKRLDYFNTPAGRPTGDALEIYVALSMKRHDKNGAPEDFVSWWGDRVRAEREARRVAALPPALVRLPVAAEPAAVDDDHRPTFEIVSEDADRLQLRKRKAGRGGVPVVCDYSIPKRVEIASRHNMPPFVVTGAHSGRVLRANGSTVEIATLLYGYRCEDFRTDDIQDPFRRRLTSAALAVAAHDYGPQMSLGNVPPRTTFDPLAGCIRDVDLAERCGLTRHRDIRRAIRKAAESGDLEILEVGSAQAARATKPLAWMVAESSPKGDRGGSQTTTVYYLTDAAAKVMVQRLGTTKAKEVQAGLRQKNAAPAATDATTIATAVAAIIAPMMAASESRFLTLLERLVPANQNAPQLPPRTVLVEAPPEGFVPQWKCARALHLPSRGEGSNLVGRWARELRMYGVAPYSTWAESAFNGKRKEEGSMVYAPCFMSTIEPAATAAQRAMYAAGYALAPDGRLTWVDGDVSQEKCADRMFQAGLEAMRRAS